MRTVPRRAFRPSMTIPVPEPSGFRESAEDAPRHVMPAEDAPRHAVPAEDAARCAMPADDAARCAMPADDVARCAADASGALRGPSAERLAAFVATVKAQGKCHHRDFSWRETRDPYEILVSEVMLQQTQVTRVERYFPRWLMLFPTVDALAAAPLSDVLEAWQGMGYNRRARMLKSACERCAEQYEGELPIDRKALLALPGIGPSTAAGVRIFAHGIPDRYLETNVRAVFLREFFLGETDIPDSALVPLIDATCDADDPRRWYYDLMDYGAWLKATVPNPSRASRHHTVQSPFEGSQRQKRSLILRACLEEGAVDGAGLTVESLAERLDAFERSQGREGISEETVRALCAALESEGMLVCTAARWHIA